MANFTARSIVFARELDRIPIRTDSLIDLSGLTWKRKSIPINLDIPLLKQIKFGSIKKLSITYVLIYCYIFNFVIQPFTRKLHKIEAEEPACIWAGPPYKKIHKVIE